MLSHEYREILNCNEQISVQHHKFQYHLKYLKNKKYEFDLKGNSVKYYHRIICLTIASLDILSINL